MWRAYVHAICSSPSCLLCNPVLSSDPVVAFFASRHRAIAYVSVSSLLVHDPKPSLSPSRSFPKSPILMNGQVARSCGPPEPRACSRFISRVLYLQPPPSSVATCFASCAKNGWFAMFPSQQAMSIHPHLSLGQDSRLPAPQAPPPFFAPPCVSCTLYAADAACTSLSRKALTSAALKPFDGVVLACCWVVAVSGRPLLDSRLWLLL